MELKNWNDEGSPDRRRDREDHLIWWRGEFGFRFSSAFAISIPHPHSPAASSLGPTNSRRVRVLAPLARPQTRDERREGPSIRPFSLVLF